MDHFNFYSSLVPMYKQYISDGGGRDSYITFESGGFIKTVPKADIFDRKATSSPRKFKQPVAKKDPTCVYYHSDGSGRDYYITHNNGGLTQQVQYGGKHDVFKESLRKPDNLDINLRMFKWADPRYKSSSPLGNKASERLHPKS